MTPKPIRVILAEDHRLVLEGLRALLEQHDSIRLVGEALDGAHAVELVENSGPDVVIMDVSLPILNGIEATRQLQRARPDIKVIILTMHDDATTVDSALRAGARGFLVKGCDAEELYDAIHRVHQGEVYLHPSISHFVLQGYLQNDQPPQDPLTPREREIVQLIAEGNTSQEIAQHLGLKTKTIQNYRAQIMDKLDIQTTAGLVRYALRAGLAH